MIRTLREYIWTLCIQSQDIKRVKRTFEYNCGNYEDIYLINLVVNSKENINNVNIRNIINTKIKSLDSRINTLDQEGENGIKEKKERI